MLQGEATEPDIKPGTAGAFQREVFRRSAVIPATHQ